MGFFLNSSTSFSLLFFKVDGLSLNGQSPPPNREDIFIPSTGFQSFPFMSLRYNVGRKNQSFTVFFENDLTSMQSSLFFPFGKTTRGMSEKKKKSGQGWGLGKRRG